MTAVDHLVVATRSLADGVPWLTERLGVEPAGHGRHERWGTHNALWALDQGTYLELIAVDPDRPAPPRPRWFGLDTAAVRRRIAERPVLLHWVLQVDDPARSPEHGEALALTRDRLAWRLTVPSTGSLPVDGTGVWPSLIRWDGPHPSAQLDDAGLALGRLVLVTPDPGPVRRRLTALGGVGLLGRRVVVAPGPVGLRAELRSPGGPVVLD